MSPFFSVIVPVYKVEPYLEKCVGSILSQTFPDFELILVDDGSPDNCPAMCDAYAEADPRVSVIHKANSGPSASRKAGLQKAAGSYVVFVDSDDTIDTDYLERVRTWITDNDFPDILLHGFTLIYPTYTEKCTPIAAAGYYDKARLEKEIYPGMMLDLRGRTFGRQLIPGYLCMKPGKRELYLKYFLADDRIRQLEDLSMIYEVLYHADSLYIAPDCMYNYLMRDGSALKSYQPAFFRTLRYVYDYVESHLVKDYPPAHTQIQAYITFLTLDAIWGEFRHNHTFMPALQHIRSEMTETGLYRDLSAERFSGLKKLYITLLRHKMFFSVVLIARLQVLLTEKPTFSRSAVNNTRTST